MSDRYSDRRGSYSDDRYSRYDEGRYADSSRRRSTRSANSQDFESDQRSARSYSRQSGNYRSTSSTRASNGAGAYADGYRSSNSGQRVSQGSDGRRRQAVNVFEDYYPEGSADTYRRSAYGSGSSGSSASRSRHARTADQQSAFSTGRTVVPARRQQGGRGSYNSQNGNYAPKKSNGKRNAIIAVIVVLAVVLVGVGAAWAYVSSISQNLHEGLDQETLDALEPASATPTALAEEPFYMLLMGVDTGIKRVENEPDADTSRSDSMILARIDPVKKKVALISIHRDTMVDMGEYGSQKINAAFQYWGPAGAIQAVSTMAGVPISHYAAVDFDGFQEIVDSIGGIEVNVPMAIHDPEADVNNPVDGGNLEAGLQTLDGAQALILCRSRHTYDDVANDGDVMRAANQRMVISAIAKKILASDVMTIANTVQKMSQYVTTDLELTDIIGLAQAFQGIDPDADIYTAMEPTTSAYIDEVWYEYLDEASWKEMISRMDQGLAPVNKTEIDDATGVILSTGGTDAPVV